MATQQALMGVGIQAEAARLLGNTPQALTTTGTSQATAAPITSKMSTFVTASSQTGAILPASSYGVVFFLATSASTSGILYPPVGGTINGTTSLTMAQNKPVVAWNTDLLTYWAVILA